MPEFIKGTDIEILPNDYGDELMQHDFILLDRSSSMAAMWDEALASINLYVKKLADDKVDTGVTLATFDTVNGRFLFEIIRDRIIPSTWRNVSSSDAVPRGMTPLNDAVGQIVSLARMAQYDKVAIIIMTDGQENASKEVTVAQAKAALDECRAKNWQVIFLGANFDNASQASSYGNAAMATASVAKGNLRSATTTLASARGSYGVTGQSINFTEEEKRKLQGGGNG